MGTSRSGIVYSATGEGVRDVVPNPDYGRQELGEHVSSLSDDCAQWPPE